MSQRHAQRFRFNGELLTVAEIKARWPVYSETHIRRSLAAGVDSLSGLAARRERSVQRQRQAQRTGSAASPWRKGMVLRREGA